MGKVLIRPEEPKDLKVKLPINGVLNLGMPNLFKPQYTLIVEFACWPRKRIKKAGRPDVAAWTSVQATKPAGYKKLPKRQRAIYTMMEFYTPDRMVSIHVVYHEAIHMATHSLALMGYNMKTLNAKYPELLPYLANQFVQSLLGHAQYAPSKKVLGVD